MILNVSHSPIPYEVEVIDLSVSHLRDLSAQSHNPLFQERLLSVLKKREHALSAIFCDFLKDTLEEPRYTKFKKLIAESKIDNSSNLKEFQTHLFSLREKIVVLFKDLTEIKLRPLMLFSQFEMKPLYIDSVFKLIPLYKELEHEHRGKDNSLEECAVTLAKWGLFQGAIVLAGKIRDPLKKDHALRAISIELLKNDRLDEALTLAETITDHMHKGYALWKISSELAKTGRLDEAVRLANTIPYAIYNHMALSEIYNESTLPNTFEEQIKLASTITNIAFRNKIFNTIIENKAFKNSKSKNETYLSYLDELDFKGRLLKLIQGGNFQKASELTETIENADTRNRFLAIIANDLALAGKFQEAITLADKIDDERLKEEAFAYIENPDRDATPNLNEKFKFLISAKKFEEAEDLAAHAPYQITKCSGYSIISVELAINGRCDEALLTANKIIDDSFRVKSLAKISSELAKQRRFTEAIKLADSIPHQSYKEWAFGEISTKFAKAGKFEFAIDLANTISFEPFKYTALATISRKLAKAGKPEEAQKIRNEIFQMSSGSWKTI